MVGLVIAGMVLQRHLALSQGPVEHPETVQGWPGFASECDLDSRGS
jgi:hypothetical protein